jgi:predicted AlkP superfamily pyrophosphatase or phosphodiesterase
MRAFVAAALALLPVLARAAPPPQPRLVVVLVVDQFAYEGMQRMRRHFGKDGLGRLLAEGAVFTEAYYSHQNTYTGPGHAAIASGAYAHLNGIVANKFYDRAKKKSVMTFADPAHPILDAPTEPEDEPSPANLLCESLGDRLRLSTGMRSRVVALALKDRGAVPLGGRLGETFWFSEATGKMTTSTYYAKELPTWVKQFNEKKIPDSFFGKAWTRALPESAYLGLDDAPWEDDLNGLGRTFPHPLHGKLDKPGPAFYAAFAATPFGLDYTVAFAKAAVEAAGLGRHEVPDLLAVSFSSYDYVGHAFGPDSHEQQDMTVRVDRAIGELLGALEKAVGGKQNLLVGFIADHGATPAPEYLASLGVPAGRIRKAAIKDAIGAELVARFGAGEWVVGLEDPNVYLNGELIAERKLEPGTVQEAAGRAAMKIPGFLTYFTRARLLQGAVENTALGRAVQLSFFPERSGDLVLVTRPYFFWGKYGERSAGSTHGSPYRYDAHVPMIFWGAGIKPGLFVDRADPIDFPSTLANLLGGDPPACAEGISRKEVVRW